MANATQALRKHELPGRFDTGIVLGSLALAAFGLVMVASSSIAIAGADDPFYYVVRHAMFLALGAALALVAMATPLEKLENSSRLLLMLAFMLLLAVFLPGLGRRINGATRWLNLGFIGFQAVEAVKLLLVAYLASYLVRFEAQVRTSLFGVLKPLGIVALLVVLLLMQPDFGSAALLLSVAAGMVWLAGARARDFGGLALLGMPVMALAAMAEPYRTLLGHFRHEIGHYYFYRLVQPSAESTARFTELFGDPDADYQAALDRHYRDGAPAGWEQQYVSSYATMHPAEDWAETFAHYLHIRDALDTAAAFGFAPAGATFERRVLGPSGFDTLIELWLPLAWALNMVNRSMGKDDLYPFVLPAAVLEKMRFIHAAVDDSSAAR